MNDTPEYQRFLRASTVLMEAWDAVTRAQHVTIHGRAYIRMIQQQAAAAWDLPVSLIIAHKRGLAYDTCRGVAMMLVSELLPWAGPDVVGACFCRQPGVVRLASSAMQRRISVEPMLGERVARLRLQVVSLLPPTVSVHFCGTTPLSGSAAPRGINNEPKALMVNRR